MDYSGTRAPAADVGGRCSAGAASLGWRSALDPIRVRKQTLGQNSFQKEETRPHPKRVNKKNKNTKKDPTLSFILREKCARRLQREQCIAVALQRQVLRSRHSSAHSLRTDASVTRRVSDMLL